MSDFSGALDFSDAESQCDRGVVFPRIGSWLASRRRVREAGETSGDVRDETRDKVID